MNYHIPKRIWEKIYSFLRSVKGLHTSNEQPLRKFVESVWYVMRTGCQWRLMPNYYGCWRSVHKRFKYWADKQIWRELMEAVQDIDGEYSMIDSTIVRAHSCSSGYVKNGNDSHALGRSKGGFTCKIHALVDALGNPLKFILTPGQSHDVTQGKPLLEGIKDTIVLADKGYDSNELISFIESNQCSAVIPPKKNRKVKRRWDRYIYKERHLVECFFNKIKHYRRVFSRFDKSTEAFMGFLHFAGALIWMG